MQGQNKRYNKAAFFTGLCRWDIDDITMAHIWRAHCHHSVVCAAAAETQKKIVGKWFRLLNTLFSAVNYLDAQLIGECIIHWWMLAAAAAASAGAASTTAAAAAVNDVEGTRWPNDATIDADVDSA